MKLLLTEEAMRLNHYYVWNKLKETGLDKTSLQIFDSIRRKIADCRPSHGGIEWTPSISRILTNECFACGSDFGGEGMFCDNCPIEWGTDKTKSNPCEQEGSPFAEWWCAGGLKRRKELAGIIAVLPWRGRKP